jgi:hypothetical protein
VEYENKNATLQTHHHAKSAPKKSHKSLSGTKPAETETYQLAGRVTETDRTVAALATGAPHFRAT